jgi:hypothetical protein
MGSAITIAHLKLPRKNKPTLLIFLFDFAMLTMIGNLCRLSIALVSQVFFYAFFSHTSTSRSENMRLTMSIPAQTGTFDWPLL